MCHDSLTYVAGNPTSWTDPSGETALGYVVRHAVKVVLACAMTGWCNVLSNFYFRYIAQGYGLLPRPQGALMITGGTAGLFVTFMACAIDIKRVDGPGPAGLHVGDGDRCFKQYTETSGVPDCHFKIAGACFEILITCLPQSVGDVRRVLLSSGCFSPDCGVVTNIVTRGLGGRRIGSQRRIAPP